MQGESWPPALAPPARWLLSLDILLSFAGKDNYGLRALWLYPFCLPQTEAKILHNALFFSGSWGLGGWRGGASSRCEGGRRTDGARVGAFQGLQGAEPCPSIIAQCSCYAKELNWPAGWLNFNPRNCTNARENKTVLIQDGAVWLTQTRKKNIWGVRGGWWLDE